MSDDEDIYFNNVPAETPLSPEDAINRRHKREKKELQGKVLAMKKNVGKLDKKRKREITEEIAKLESELETRQKCELDAFRPIRILSASISVPATVQESEDVKVESSKTVDGGSGVMPPVVILQTKDSDVQNDTGGSAPGTPKLSRARRRREKKETEEREKQKRIESESNSLLEGSKMKSENDVFECMMKDLNLAIVDIDPDGHCLYNAVADQLKRVKGKTTNASKLRSVVSNYLRSHKDEFSGFLDEEYSGSDEGFQKYCNELENSSVWGGLLEVRILSQVLECPIKVLQAEGQPVMAGEKFATQPLTLTYHRHKYQLGEHYNSTTVAE